MECNKSRGVAILVVILLGTLITTALSSVGYGVYKYRQTTNENKNLKAQFEAQNNSLNQNQEQSTDVNGSTTNAENIEASLKAYENEPVHAVKAKEIVYVPQTSILSDAERQAEIDTAIQKALAEQQNNLQIVMTPEPIQEIETQVSNAALEPIKVSTVRQTSYPDGYGGVYGSYELEIIVAPTGGDILIPISTSDTIETGLIGFSYSISGDSFTGTQDSEVSSCTLRSGDYCKIKDGQVKSITVTVWLTPDEEGDGNYAVNFEQVLYYFNNEERTFDVDRKTSKINLFY